METMIQFGPLAFVFLLYTGLVGFVLVLAWRLVKAQEMIARSLDRIAEGSANQREEAGNESVEQP